MPEVESRRLFYSRTIRCSLDSLLLSSSLGLMSSQALIKYFSPCRRLFRVRLSWLLLDFRRDGESRWRGLEKLVARRFPMRVMHTFVRAILSRGTSGVLENRLYTKVLLDSSLWNDFDPRGQQVFLVNSSLNI